MSCDYTIALTICFVNTFSENNFSVFCLDKTFVESVIEKLLNKELYFTTPPITKDNALTDINYFIYNLEENKQEN